jgi:DNA-binding CsgD family transcriptional regulator
VGGSVRALLTHADAGPGTAKLLTAGERRVADFTASGMTNREVATALFVSPKTVEVHLTRIYRKLNVHTRAALAGVSITSSHDRRFFAIGKVPIGTPGHHPHRRKL